MYGIGDVKFYSYWHTRDHGPLELCIVLPSINLGDLFVDTPFSLAAVLPFKLNLFEVIWLHLRQITVMSE